MSRFFSAVGLLAAVLSVCAFDVSLTVPAATERVLIGDCQISVPKIQHAVLMPSCRLSVPTCGRGITHISFRFLSSEPLVLLVWQARDYDLEITVTAAGTCTIVQSTGDIDTVEFPVAAAPAWQDLFVDATQPGVLLVSVNGGRAARVVVDGVAALSTSQQTRAQNWLVCEMPAGPVEVRSINDIHGAQLVETLAQVPEWMCSLSEMRLEDINWAVSARSVQARLVHTAGSGVVSISADSLALLACAFGSSHERAYIPVTRDLSVGVSVCFSSGTCDSATVPVIKYEHH